MLDGADDVLDLTGAGFGAGHLEWGAPAEGGELGVHPLAGIFVGAEQGLGQIVEPHDAHGALALWDIEPCLGGDTTGVGARRDVNELGQFLGCESRGEAKDDEVLDRQPLLNDVRPLCIGADRDRIGGTRIWHVANIDVPNGGVNKNGAEWQSYLCHLAVIAADTPKRKDHAGAERGFEF